MCTLSHQTASAGQGKTMSDKKSAKSDESKDNILGRAFRASMHASQSMQQTAIDIPLNMLKALGVAEDKMDALRAKSHEMISGMYEAFDSAAVKTGFVSPRDKKEGKAKEKGAKD